MKVVGLCDKDTGVGLRLAGITKLYIPNEKTSLQLWNTLIDDPSIGLILITEKIADQLGNHLSDFRLRNQIPIIIEIPDKTGHQAEHKDFVSTLIKKAVGIEISTPKKK